MASYEKSKASGLWSVRFRETDASGTHNKRLSGFKTKKEAQYAYEDYITNRPSEPLILSEEAAPQQSISYDDILSKYLNYQRARLKATSYYDLTHKFDLRITPFFKGKPLDAITPITILEWMNTIEEYSYKYRKNLFGYLVSYYSYAEKYHDIKNVMKKVDRPRNLEARKEMLIYSPEEFARLISAVNRPDYNMLLTFLYLSGCRRGEALALTWNKLRESDKTVTINQNVVYKVGENGKSYRISTTKNQSSNRTIPLPAFFFDRLKEYRTWQQSNVKNLPDGDAAFVFGGADPLPPTSIERILTKAAEATGLKRIRIHDLRHSCASYLIHKGVSIVAVSRHLGHASTQQTFDTYSHILPDDRTIIYSNLDALSSIIN